VARNMAASKACVAAIPECDAGSNVTCSGAVPGDAISFVRI